jgi:hypothetical protein
MPPTASLKTTLRASDDNVVGTVVGTVAKRHRNAAKTEVRRTNLSQMPFHILLDIFLLAAARDGKTINHYGWYDARLLVNFATTCKAFYDPALVALYRHPGGGQVIYQGLFLEKIWQSFSRRPELLKYVRSFYVDLNHMSGDEDLWSLLELLPNLKEIWVQDYLKPWGVEPMRVKKYPSRLFHLLEHVGTVEALSAQNSDQKTRLEGWKWDSVLFNKEFTAQDITQIHQGHSFQSLKRLAMYNMPIRFELTHETPSAHWLLCLGALPHLEDLHLCNCPISGDEDPDTILPNLRLKRLTISIPSLKDEMLPSLFRRESETTKSISQLLSSNICSNLQHLILDGLHSCSLGFLCILSNTKLQTLHYSGMDLEKSVVSILPTTVTPFYPPTLISLKFKGLRKWESQESLEMFLDSLLSAAPKLTYLRELELYCIMDCTSDYKQRAEIREKYEDRLLHAFVRPHTKQPSLINQRGSRLRDVLGIRELDDSYKGFAEPDRVEVKFDNMRPGGGIYILYCSLFIQNKLSNS